MEEIKKECIERLNILGLDSKIINDFVNDEKVYISSIDGDIMEATKYDFVSELMKNFEQTKKVKVYHIISIEREMRSTVHILYVSQEKSNWKSEKEDLKNGYTEVHTLEEVRVLANRNIGIDVKNGKITKVV